MKNDEANEKQKALEEVKTILKNISKTLKFINSKSNKNIFKVSFSNEDIEDNVVETDVLCDKKYLLDGMASAYKENLISRLNYLMNEYDITLTIEELKIIE